MKSRTKRIISTLAICGALILEAGAATFGSLGRALNKVIETRAAVGDKVTSLSSIDSNTSYYLQVDFTSGKSSGNTVNIKGNMNFDSSSTGASVKAKCSGSLTSGVDFFILESSTSGKYNLQINDSKGYYFAPNASNGTVKISEDPIDVDVSVSSSLWTFSIVSGSDTWSIQTATAYPTGGNVTNAGFGGYKSAQQKPWLVVASTGGGTTEYTVTFDANGHGTAPSAATVSAGGTVTKPSDPSATGYTFGGWYTEKNCTNEYNFSSAVNSSFTLYAKWIENGGGGSDTGETVSTTFDFHSKTYGASTTVGVQTLTNGDYKLYSAGDSKNGAKVSAATPSNTSYFMFGKSGQYLTNTYAPMNSYLSNVSFKYSDGVSTNVQLAISTGSSVMSSSGKDEITLAKATKNGEVSKDFTNQDNSYFFIRVTNAYNAQLAYITITWTLLEAEEYDVVATLNNCTSDGDAKCNTGEDYVATFTPKSGYNTVSVTDVKTNNNSLTLNTDYTFTNNKLTINKSSITGDISFTATAGKASYTVSASGTGVTFSSKPNATYLTQYQISFSVNDGYDAPTSASAIVGGTPVDGVTLNGTTITVPAAGVTGNLTITANATLHEYELSTSSLQYIEFEQETDSSLKHGETFAGTLSAVTGYTLEGAEITVSMGGDDVTEDVLANDYIQIDEVTGDIVISGIGIKLQDSTVAINQDEFSIEENDSDTLTVEYANATLLNSFAELDDGIDVVTFGSLNTTTGEITLTPKAKGIGFYTLTVTFVNNQSQNDEIDFDVYVEVYGNELTGITLSQESGDYYLGDNLIHPTVTAHYSLSDDQTVTASWDDSEYNKYAVGSYSCVATYEGKTATYTANVAAKEYLGPEPVPANTVLFAEPFTGFSKDSAPTAPGSSATVYGSSSVSYTCTNGGTNTKIYEEALAGGTSPEILVSKTNGSFEMKGLPTGSAKVLSFTYKKNNTNNSASCSSTAYTLTGDSGSYTLTLKDNTVAPETIDITIANSKGSNTRIDDIELKITTPAERAKSDEKHAIRIAGAECIQTGLLEGQTISLSDFNISVQYDTNAYDNDINPSSATNETAGALDKTKYVAGNNTIQLSFTDDYENTVTKTIDVLVGEVTHVTSVTLGNTVDSLIVGQSNIFTATVAPEDATYPSVSWSVEGTGATIDQTGKLTTSGVGTVTVKATADGITATHQVQIVADTVASIAVKQGPTKTSYYKGETINLSGLVITATMASGQTHDIAYSATSGITCTQEKAGISDESITISFEGKTTTTAISVHEPNVTSISANTTAISIGYGTDLKDSTLVITATYEDGTSTPVTDYEIDENFDNTDYSDPQDVEITFGGKTVTIKVTVLEPKINSLDVVETYVKVPYGEDLKNYITVMITTEDDATKREYSGYDISLDFDNTDKSQVQDVRISAGEGVYDNLDVEIVDSVTIKTVDSVSGPTVVDYGTSISASQFTVNVTYTDDLSGAITPTSFVGYDPEKVGAQTVTLYKGDEEITDVTVTVSPSTVVDHLEIISCKEEVAYGGSLTTADFTVKAVYTDGHYDEEASHPDSISGFVSTTRGTQTVTLTYKGVTVDSEVKVLDSTVVASATVTSYPDNLTYGSTLSYTDIVLSVTYTDGRTVDNLNPDSISGYTGEPGENTIHYVIGNYEDDIKVTVLPSTVIGSITASTEKTEVAYGGTFTAADVSVTYVYTDTHTLTGQAAESISGFDPTNVGTQTITVTAQGKTTTITVTVLPSTVIDSITASTEKTEVAYGGSFTAADVSVTYVYTDNHTLTGQAAESISGFDPTKVGAQTVTVNAAGKETTITVTVLPSTVIGSITASTEKTEVAYGGTFTAADVSVTYVYTDNHTLTGQAAESISGFDPTKVGAQTVTVNAAGKETTITVTVLPSTVIDHITASTEKTEVEYGGTFTKDDVSVVATYTDGHTGSINCESISGFDGNVAEAQTVTVNAGGKETTITVTVKASEVIDHIEVSTDKTVVDYGGTFTKEDVKVTYVYTDGHRVENKPAESISGFEATTIGEQTITVAAAGKTATLTITVNGHVVTSLDVTGYTDTVDQGKDYVFDGEVKAHYADGQEEVIAEGYVVSKVDTSGHGDQKAKVSFGGVEVEITIHIVQTKTEVEPYLIPAIAGGAVIGLSIVGVALFFFFKKFKI